VIPRRLLARLRRRPDSEHEMSLNRLGFAVLIGLYLAAVPSPDPAAALTSLALWCGFSVGLFLHILARPGASSARRAAALLLDIGFLSWLLHQGGEAHAVFFAIYLWVVFGNGFRFGLPWLWLGTAAALTGFGLVVLATPYWREQPHLAFGLLAGLAVLPAYVAVLIRKLSEARRQAEAASQAKTLFLAGVSHELRTPLNAIIGMGALLRGTRLDPDQRDMARTMDIAARSLLDLIDDILDLTRIEAGRMPTRAEPCDLAELLEEVRSLLVVQAAARGIRLGLHLGAGVPWRVRLDRRHLREILVNLAGNAVKFTEAGGVSIGLAAAREEGERVRLRFEVSDTGIGIPADAQGRIFDNFTQAGPEIAGRFGGTGLGLAICRRLAELLGGELTVESAPGAGSTFRLELTAERLPDPAPGQVPPGTLALLVGPGARPLAPALAALGLELRSARNPAEAAALLAAAEGPRVVLGEPAALGLAPRPGRALATPPALAAPALLVEPAPAPHPPRDARRWAAGSVTPAATPAQLALALRVAGLGAPAEAPAAAPAGAPATRRLRVLVADDNAVNRKVAARILESGGHEVVLAEDGEAALDALDAAALPGAPAIDLALMDVNMPGIDGVEATKLHRMASLGAPRRVPILALTADITPEAEARCREAGMDGCVTKPVEPARLLAVVAAHAAPSPPATPPPGPEPEPPRARPARMPAVDRAALARLEALGGPAFLSGLLDDFLAEAETLLRDLTTAASTADSATFRARAHALGSCAANIGAYPLQALCRAAQRLGSHAIAGRGPAEASAIAQELRRVRDALAPSAG
jgi:two-component system sensor histidine kinase RpfC